jgi:hypothetical protein
MPLKTLELAIVPQTSQSLTQRVKRASYLGSLAKTTRFCHQTRKQKLMVPCPVLKRVDSCRIKQVPPELVDPLAKILVRGESISQE